MKLLYLKMKELLKPYIGYEILGIITTILYASFSFFTPKVSEYLIDEVIPAKSYSKLFVGVGIFVLICVLQPLISWIKDRIFINITENVTYDIRKKIFEKIIVGKFSFFDNVKGGELISIIMNDGRAVSNFISNIFAVLLNNGLMIIMIVIGMVNISWKITSVVFVLFIVFGIINVKFKNKIQDLSENIQINYDNICSCINQANNTIVSIKMNNQEERAIKNYEKIIKKMKKDNITFDRVSVLIKNLTMIIVVLCLGVIYGCGSLYVISGKMTIGNVIALGLYFQLLTEPLYSIMGTGISTNTAVPIFKRLDKYFELESENIGECKQELEFDEITVKNLCFKYSSKEKLVLKDVNFSLKNRGLVLLEGVSGSGKTTIIKLLMGMYDIEDNIIMFGKRDINEISKAELRKVISYVPQECELLNESILENIRYGLVDVKNEEIEDICKKLNLHEKITSLKEGYETIITERINLSGGERQRMLMARGLLRKSKILILDEPLANIDEKNVQSVINIINEVAKNKLVLMITHQKNENLKFSRKIMLEKGEIINIKDND